MLENFETEFAQVGPTTCLESLDLTIEKQQCFFFVSLFICLLYFAETNMWSSENCFNEKKIGRISLNSPAKSTAVHLSNL